MSEPLGSAAGNGDQSAQSSDAPAETNAAPSVGVVGAASTTSVITPSPSSTFTTSAGETTTNNVPAVTSKASSDSSSSNPNKDGSDTPNGVGTGALAGGIVGALIVGLLLGSILGLLWARSRRRRRSRHKPQLEKGSSMSKTPFAATRSVSDSGSEDAVSWQVHLPQPADDSSLRRSVKTVMHQIDQHVENFYIDSNNESHVAESSGLAFYETDLLPVSLSEALRCAQNKKAIIKHCLTHFILTRIDPECQPAHSFLPFALSALPSTIVNRAGDTSEGITKDKRVFNEAYAQYRVLAGYLTDTPTSTSTTSPALSRAHQEHFDAAAVAKSFSATFHPWLASSPSAPHAGTTAVVANLADIIRHAADVGRVLAIQPCRFRFVWTQAQAPAGMTSVPVGQKLAYFQVSPAVVKVTDVHGRELVERQVFVEGVGADGRRV